MGLGPGNEGFDNLDPILQQIALRIVAESGGRVSIGSGWRSIEQQSRIYDLWRKGQYDAPRVAPPGRSQHNHGRAIDFSGDLRLAQELGRKYGLIFPMGDEPWHGQLGENVGSGVDPAMGSGVQYNLNYMGMGKPASPEEVLANRMSSIMSIVGGDMFSSGAQQFAGPTTDMAQQYIQPTADAVQSTVDPLSPEIPEQGARQTSPLSPTQYQLPQIEPGMSPDQMQVNYGVGGDKEGLGQYARSLFGQFGFDESDYPALVWLWNKESGDPAAGSNRVTWDPLAQNPTSTAFGIAQFLNGTWKGTGISKTTNPMQQIMAGLTYIKARYGNPRNALNFHMRNNWY